jgi:hypothetical protein
VIHSWPIGLAGCFIRPRSGFATGGPPELRPHPPDRVDVVDTDDPPPDTDPPPANTFTAEPLWAPLELDGAIGLGHVPAPVATPIEPGPIVLTRIVPDGLDDSASGGDMYGVGLAFVDVDADGWDDLFVASGLAAPDGVPSSLWRNVGDGTFEDITASSGVAAVMSSRDALSVAATSAFALATSTKTASSSATTGRRSPT